jgi:hypothetical protein
MLKYYLLYGGGEDLKLTYFTYFSWVGFVDDKKSTTGHFFTIGTCVFLGRVSWLNKKQVVALSSFETKYKATLITTSKIALL